MDNVVHQRPWGNYEVLLIAPNFQVKRVTIEPLRRLSLQKHSHRSENWIVVSGSGIAVLGDKEIAVSRGSYLRVSMGEVHRMHNTGQEPLVFIEVQLGDYLGEDDIIRLQDDFSRI